MKSIIEKCVMIALLFVFAVPAWAQTPIWGPEHFYRETPAIEGKSTGKPSVITMEFSAPDPSWQYIIHVRTGTTKSYVSSATIKINGQVVIGPDDFNQKVAEISKTIDLCAHNEISVKVAGKPGAALTVTIYGPNSTDVVTSAGGSVVLDGFAEVLFPAGAFKADTPVNICVTSSIQTQYDYELSKNLLYAGPNLTHEIRINSGSVPPSKDFHVELDVPANFINNLPPDHEIAAFVQLYQDGGEEILDNFVRAVASFNPAESTLNMGLPSWVFTNKRNTEQTYEALIICGSAQVFNANNYLMQTEEPLCPIMFGYPLPDKPKITSPYGLRWEGVHLGTDFRAVVGTSVLAMADGEVTFIDKEVYKEDVYDSDGNLIHKKGDLKGWGHFIIVRHGPPGSAMTLYAHLKEKPDFFDVGDYVLKGDMIALSGKSGTKDPHLHVEYMTPGCYGADLYNLCLRADVEPCLADDYDFDIFAICVDDNCSGEELPGGTLSTVYVELAPWNPQITNQLSVELLVNLTPWGEAVPDINTNNAVFDNKRLPNLWSDDMELTANLKLGDEIKASKTVTFGIEYNWDFALWGLWQVGYQYRHYYTGYNNDVEELEIQGSGILPEEYWFGADFTANIVYKGTFHWSDGSVSCTETQNEERLFCEEGPYDEGKRAEVQFSDDPLMAGTADMAATIMQTHEFEVPGGYIGGLLNHIIVESETCAPGLEIESRPLKAYLGTTPGTVTEIVQVSGGSSGVKEERTRSLAFLRKGIHDCPLFSYEVKPHTPPPSPEWSWSFTATFEEVQTGSWESYATGQSSETKDIEEDRERKGEKQNPDEANALSQNFPNPFNPTTTISFSVPEACAVCIEIFNVNGERIRTLIDKELPEGEHAVSWNGKDYRGRNVDAGIYFYRLVAGDFVQTKKMVLLR